MNDPFAGTGIPDLGEKNWDRIISLIRSKNVLPQSITDDDIKTVVYRVYKRWRFYPDSSSSLRKVIEMAADGQLDNSFFNEIFENINRIPEFTHESEEQKDQEVEELRSVRTRFDQLADFERESYLERARRILRPSFHNNPEAVLFAALELMLHDDTQKKFTE